MTHAHMDTVAAHYDETIPPHVQEHYLRKRAAFIQTHAGRGWLVDVGGGTGAVAERLRVAGFRTVVMDASLGMLHEAQERRQLLSVGADAAQLPLRSGSVATVISIASLHHMGSRAQVRRIVEECWRVLAPGGRLILWDHNPLNPYWPLFMQRLPQDQEPTRLVPLRELVEELRRLQAQPLLTWRLGLVPDFAPPRLLPWCQRLEALVERTPGLRCLCAHNVVVAGKTPAAAPQREVARVAG